MALNTIQSWRKKLESIWQNIWPIDWGIFQKPALIYKSLKNSTYTVKTVFLLSSIGLIVSSVFFTFGLYLSVSSEIPSFGGHVYEGVVGDSLNTFNPVVDLNISEQKISSLLFLPLYFVDHPDYLNDPTAQPSIEPVLLSSEPEWQDADAPLADRFKTLRFELKPDIAWSDGSAITRNDVKYTFERLKEKDGNPAFSGLFKEIDFVESAENPLIFDLVSKTPNPQLKWSANFQPISRDFYNSQDTARLLVDPSSFKVYVSSGWFKVTEGKVNDPLRDDTFENPVFDIDNSSFRVVQLEKSGTQNYANDVYVDNYSFLRLPSIIDPGGSDTLSIARAAQDGSIDYFDRYVDASLSLSPEKVRESTGLNQKVVPTNTYFSLFLNAKVRTYLINQSLRKYIVCSLVDWQAQSPAEGTLEPIERTKRIAPFALGEIEPDCPANPAEALDAQFYTLVEREGGVRRVLLNDSEISLKLLGLIENQPLLSELQTYMLDIGLPVDIIPSDQVAEALADKTYNLALLPVTLNTADPYPVFGSQGRNLSVLNLNNRIRDYNVEENLTVFSRSSLQDEQARENLRKFFSEQHVMVNLYRNYQEYNYSNRLTFESTDDSKIWERFFQDEWSIYQTIPRWYIKTQRRLGRV